MSDTFAGYFLGKRRALRCHPRAVDVSNRFDDYYSQVLEVLSESPTPIEDCELATRLRWQLGMKTIESQPLSTCYGDVTIVSACPHTLQTYMTSDLAVVGRLSSCSARRENPVD